MTLKTITPNHGTNNDRHYVEHCILSPRTSRRCMAVHDIQKKEWLLLEGTVCGIGKIADRTSKKQMKYRDLRSGIKQMYPQHKVTQVNKVFDFLGNYHKDLKTQAHNHVILRNTDKQQINSKITSGKETRYLLQKSQKWILS